MFKKHRIYRIDVDYDATRHIFIAEFKLFIVAYIYYMYITYKYNLFYELRITPQRVDGESSTH